MATVLSDTKQPLDMPPPPANDDGTGYRPHADEPFMNPRQQAYFRAKLLAWKDAIHREAQEGEIRCAPHSRSCEQRDFAFFFSTLGSRLGSLSL